MVLFLVELRYDNREISTRGVHIAWTEKRMHSLTLGT